MSSPVRTRSKKPTSWWMMCSNSRLRSRHITRSALALNSLQNEQSMSEHLSVLDILVWCILLQIQQHHSLPDALIIIPEGTTMAIKRASALVFSNAASLPLDVCRFLHCILHLCDVETARLPHSFCQLPGTTGDEMLGEQAHQLRMPVKTAPTARMPMICSSFWLSCLSASSPLSPR